MARRHRHLLDPLQVERAKPKSKPYRLADGGALYLWVPTSGVKAWQYRYRLGGMQQTATLGKYSKLQGLAWAREEAEKARAKVEAGDHLTRAKALKRVSKTAAAGNTFLVVRQAWVKKEARASHWTPAYKDEVTASLTNHLSELDPLPLADITAAIAAPYLRRVERASPDMAKKVRQRLRSIFDAALEDGIVGANPIPVPKRRKKKEGRRRLPAILAKDGVGKILRAADKADVGKGVRRAHLLAVFTAQRIGEIVPAAWDEVDLDEGIWTIPRDRMKRKDEDRGPHVVPVPPVLLAKMREWRETDNGKAQYVCASTKGNPITREAVEKFYRHTLDLSGKHSPHSWRSVLSTWANDAGEDADVVEAQLDHATGSQVKTAYDRAQRLKRRADLMAWHEQALIAARDGARVVELKRSKTVS